MDEDILQPKVSNPTETALLIFTSAVLIFSIVLSSREVGEYLSGTDPSDYETPVVERIRSKYLENRKLRRIRKKMESQSKQMYGLVSTQEGESQ